MTADHQAARDTDYARTYRAWVATLPPEEIATLTANGIDQPDTSRRVSRPQGDAKALARVKAPECPPDKALLAAEATPEAMADHPDEFEGIPAPDHTQPAAADALVSFCARIRAHPSPLLALDAFCFAAGIMDAEGLSETALAAHHGVTTAAFSKLAVQFCDTFGLPPSRGMRSPRARHAHRDARLNSLSKRHDQHQTA